MRILKSANLMIVGMVVLVAVGILVSPSYAKIDPDTIVGMWLFDEGEGDVAEDSSENGFDGKIMNGAKWVDGKFGDALEFDGADDYVDFGKDEKLKPQQFTVVAWFNTRKVNDNGHIFQSGKGWNDMAGILIKVDKSGVLWAVMATAPGNTISWYNGPNLSAETWHHAAFTFDGANVVLYLDGEKVAGGTEAKVFYDECPVRVGSEPNKVDWLFDGFIDEVAYFNEALRQEDIQLIMNEGLEKAIGITAVDPLGKLPATWASIKAQD